MSLSSIVSAADISAPVPSLPSSFITLLISSLIGGVSVRMRPLTPGGAIRLLPRARRRLDIRTRPHPLCLSSKPNDILLLFCRASPGASVACPVESLLLAMAILITSVRDIAGLQSDRKVH